MIKKSVVLVLFISLSLALPSIAKRFTHGFKLAKIRLDIPWSVDYEEIPSLQVEKILSQDFTYLNRGAQCYAFLSEDKKYVLKLFRFDQRSLFRKKKNKRPIREKAGQFFESCKLAARLAPDETGLVFLHLNPTETILPILHAKGPLKVSFTVPLDHCRFALQKKAKPMMDVFIESHKNGELPKRLEEMIALLESRISKKIGNTDPSLWRNFAFLEDKAVEIDFGNYIFRPDFSKSENAKVELERYVRPLRLWLKKHAPELMSFFNERIEKTVL